MWKYGSLPSGFGTRPRSFVKNFRIIELNVSDREEITTFKKMKSRLDNFQDHEIDILVELKCRARP